MLHENRHNHQFEFKVSGEARLQTDNIGEPGFEETDAQSRKAVQTLNARRGIIADAIIESLEQQMPEEYRGSIKFVASIKFRQGSFLWDAVVLALDWMGKAVDTVAFTQMMAVVIRLVVNKVILREAVQNNIPIQQETIYVDVRPAFIPASQVDTLYRDILERQEEEMRLIRSLAQEVSSMRNYLNQLREKNPAFRPSSYSSRTVNRRPVQQSSWYSKEVLLLLVLLFILLIQLIDYFPFD